MRIILSTVVAALLFQVEAGQTAQKSGLTRLLDAELARFSGPAGPYRAGIYVKHLLTGEEASVRGSEHFESASTIKLAVLVLAYRLADQNKLNLNERYIVNEPDFRGGGIIRLSDPGLNPTIRDIMTEMVITSNNTATDIMIAKVGGTDRVNAFLKEAGFSTLRLNSTTFEYFRQRYDIIDPKYKSLTPIEFYALQNRQPTATVTAEMIERINDEAIAHHVDEEMIKRRRSEEHWFGVASPAEMGRLLEGIERGTIASKQSCAEMKRIMLGQKSGTRKISHYLHVPVAHKTGETGGVTNDVGMIYAHSGPIIISFYTIGYTGQMADADERLGHVARLIVEYFDGTD